MIVLLFGWLRRTLSWSNVQVTTELCELWHSDILWCTWICVVGVGGESIAASIGSLLTHIGSWIWYLCLCCCTSSCRVKLHGDTSKFHGAPNKRMARLLRIVWYIINTRCAEEPCASFPDFCDNRQFHVIYCVSSRLCTLFQRISDSRFTWIHDFEE